MEDQEQFEQLVYQLREKHERVYSIYIGDEQYIIRPLSRKEYESIVTWHGEEHAIENAVCEAGVLYPTRNNWEESPAGITPELHKQIVELSGFRSTQIVEDYLNAGRALMGRFHDQASTIVAAVFSQYTFEEIDTWSVEKLMRMAARAEWKLQRVDELPIKLSLTLPESDEEEAPEPPTLAEIGQQLREEGRDPILEFGPPEKPPYVEFPLIAGTKIWKNEELLSLVRKQVQRLPGQ